MPKILKVFLLFIVTVNLVYLSGCVTSEYNLATGENETYFLSAEKEVSLGRSLAEKIEKKFKLADSETQNRINNIGIQLADVCDRQDICYHFKVIKDKEVNALSLPGGFIYVSDSLVKKVSSDDEIAAVLAHEIGHVAARHSVKRMQGNYLYNFLRILVSQMPSDDLNMNREIDFAFANLIIRYAKEDEVEADKLSVKYMKRAGFNSSALLSMLDKIEEVELKEGPKRLTYYKTHPPIAARKGIIRQAITGQIDFMGYLNRPESISY